MNRRWNSLMVAVGDLDRSAQSLLSKAGQLAKRFDASLHVLHIFAHPHVPSGRRRQERIDAAIEPLIRQFEQLVRPIQQSGVQVSSSVVWDYPALDAILKHVLARESDALIIQSHQGGRLDRWFLTNTDWELIRYCPCPLWITASAKLPPRLSVLAAIDPSHAHAKSAKLDGHILAAAGQVARAGRGRLGVCHVYPLPTTALLAVPIVVPPTPAEARDLRARAMRAVDQLIGRQKIARKDRIVMTGDPTALLPVIAKHWKADVLVMGGVSRSGLKRVFIGNTAERILGAVDCDVLVVKPPSFKCPVRLTLG